MKEILLYGALGVLACVSSGVFGIGGGVVLITALTLILKMPHHTANAVSLTALLLPVGTFGVIAYYRAGKIGMPDIRAGLLIACGMAVGTFLGAKLAVRMPEDMLRRTFAVFLVFVAARMFFR